MICKLAKCISEGDDFGKCLNAVLKEMGIRPIEFSRKSKIPHSTLYKILKGEKPRYDTLAKIFSALRKGDKFVAVIAARYVLEDLSVEGSVRFYAATTLEDAIVSLARAEKDGAGAIVCAPILSGIAERIVDIPIITIRPHDSILKAVRLAMEKIKG
ncbi:transcriptional regulator [Archaeoglobales archaeon ex4484_92]|nr:MAG: transcriptional regulator [Archaeoglobales archaeon ex4484_92]